MSENFNTSPHCTTRAHCLACRNDDSFLASLEGVFGKIACPLNLPRPCPDDQLPAKTKETLARVQALTPPVLPPCKHAEDTGEKVNTLRPCAGTWVTCHHPDSTLPKVMSKSCGSGRCKLYVR